MFTTVVPTNALRSFTGWRPWALKITGFCVQYPTTFSSAFFFTQYRPFTLSTPPKEGNWAHIPICLMCGCGAPKKPTSSSSSVGISFFFLFFFGGTSTMPSRMSLFPRTGIYDIQLCYICKKKIFKLLKITRSMSPSG